jgi:hypothetical protein
MLKRNKRQKEVFNLFVRDCRISLQDAQYNISNEVLSSSSDFQNEFGFDTWASLSHQNSLETLILRGLEDAIPTTIRDQVLSLGQEIVEGKEAVIDELIQSQLKSCQDQFISRMRSYRSSRSLQLEQIPPALRTRMENQTHQSLERIRKRLRLFMRIEALRSEENRLERRKTFWRAVGVGVATGFLASVIANFITILMTT